MNVEKMQSGGRSAKRAARTLVLEKEIREGLMEAELGSNKDRGVETRGTEGTAWPEWKIFITEQKASRRGGLEPADGEAVTTQGL